MKAPPRQWAQKVFEERQTARTMGHARTRCRSGHRQGFQLHTGAETLSFVALPHSQFFRIVKEWKYISPEQEVQLAQIATKAGTDPEHFGEGCRPALA